MILVLLAKDLRRAWRNPIPWLINLAVPIVITALIGLAFAPSSERSGLGRIKLAVVDEDDSALTGFLRGALNQQQGGKYLEPVFLSRAEALRRITDNQLSAVVIIPKAFTHDFLTGQPVALELVKNPAQAFHPAIIEELLGALVTALNAVSRNFQSEFPEWWRAFERTNDLDLRGIGNLLVRAGDKLESARPYLFPPLVGYEKAQRGSEQKAEGPGRNIFAFLLAGMAAMFLLFLGDNAVRDLYREVRFRTMERFHSLHEGLFVFVTSKVVFALAILLLSEVILLGGGALVFRFRWTHPAELAVLGLAYAFFVAGFMALLAALAGKEKRADVLNSVTVMILSLAGGCMFPTDQLPAFLREHISSWLPTNWFVEAVRTLQFGGSGPAWGWASLKLALFGWLLIAAASWLFHWRLAKGIRE
jgi:ABC-type multidrug transport system permease subunit